MNVGLRVDASTQIGTGHVARCLALAQALRAAGAMPHFVLRDLGMDAASHIRAAGFEVTRLPSPARPWRGDSDIAHAAWAGVGQEEDAADTMQALSSRSPSWVIVDHYAFDATWHRAIARALGCRLAAIDDLADRSLDVSVLIDHNFAGDHRAKYHARITDQVAILGGPRHALLGPAYADAPRCEVGDDVTSIGVFMGGSDAGGYSLMALSAIEAVGFAGEVEVAATSANPGLQELRAAVAQRPGTALSLDLPDLAAFFARHDLQIGAGGGATWERCCIGAPTLAVVVAENQRRVLEPLAELSVLATGEETPPTVGSLARGLRAMLEDAALRRRLSVAARHLVDGRGANRVAGRLLSL